MLGEKIKYLRKQAGLSQSRLAEELNEKYGMKIERSMISKWETGFQTPMMYSIQCIANYFGVTIGYLTEEKPPEPDGNQEIIELISKMTTEEKEEFKRIALYVLSKRDQ